MSDQNLPEKYRAFLTTLQGRPYLEVKYRLMWFREENPAGSIETELISDVQKRAVFKAEITGEVGVATGHGSETFDDFGDYLEKAETKAIGRALGALGYGTQFCMDFDEGDHKDGSKNVVDSPVRPAGRPAPGWQRPSAAPVPMRPGAQSGVRMASDPQKKLLWRLLKQEGVDNQAQYHGGENNITSDQVRAAIDTLKAREGDGMAGQGELPDWKVLSGQIILDDTDEWDTPSQK